MSALAHLVSANPNATYADIEAAPPHWRAEIVNGRLHTQPRPRVKHIHAGNLLGRLIGTPYEDGTGGPGGWWILIEPEIHFELNKTVAVPDLAGWRRERMPELPEDQRCIVVPDWICEILSPATRDYDRNEKRDLYARFGVRYLWLVDLENREVTIYANLPDSVESVRYRLEGGFRAEPFTDVTIIL